MSQYRSWNMVWTTKELVFVSKQELEFFVFSAAFASQALSQFMLGTSSLGCSGRGRKLTTCLQWRWD